MSTHWRAALAGAIAVVMAAPSVVADERVRGSGGGMLVPPPLATARQLFNPIQEAKDPACPKKEEFIRHYMSGTILKSGNVKLLSGDLPQAFADVWRQRLHLKPVAVSAVVAQPLDLSPLGGGPAFDVTEFGADGCAFSRTVMPAAIWREVLLAAAGHGV